MKLFMFIVVIVSLTFIPLLGWIVGFGVNKCTPSPFFSVVCDLMIVLCYEPLHVDGDHNLCREHFYVDMG